MGLIKTTVLLGFTLAAYNLDRIRSFKAKAWLGRRRSGSGEAEAAPGSSPLRDMDRDYRVRPRSPPT